MALIAILWISALTSSFVDNIPFTAAMVRRDWVLGDLGWSGEAWMIGGVPLLFLFWRDVDDFVFGGGGGGGG